MKKTLVCLALAALVLGAVLLVRTLTWQPVVRTVVPAPELEIDTRRVCVRLARALQIESVSKLQPDSLALGRMEQMVTYVRNSFTPLMEQLKFERHPANLVLRWEGTDPQLKPLLLLAHLDVVPVDPLTADHWSFPPFSGEVAGGYVWGRGAMDDKSSAFAMLEAIEILLLRGYQPRRSVVLSLGLDEEIGGEAGAKTQAARFADEGFEAFMILDEGYAVLDGVLDVIDAPVAVVGIAEKGQLTLELRVATEGGHASMPEAQTSVGILAQAIANLESHPLPARVDGAPGLFFDELAREMRFGPRFLFANRWLTEPVLRRFLVEKATTAALLRTTTAVTMTSAGIAPNVLPQEARATVNFRIHSRDDVAGVMEHVRVAIDDPRVSFHVVGESDEPSAVSPAEGEAWALLEKTIRECYAGVVVAPSLVIGATDARHYAALSPNIYRFNGLRLGPADLARLHGVNERISTTNYIEMIRFYLQLMQNG